MRTIYKYPINLNEKQSILTYEGAKPLRIAIQESTICVWMEVSTEEKKVDKNIYCFGTGFELPNLDLKYIGSVDDFPFVWHIYYEE